MFDPRQTIDRLQAGGSGSEATDSENREHGWSLGRMWLETKGNLAQIRRLMGFAGPEPAVLIRSIQRDGDCSLGCHIYAAITGRDRHCTSEGEAAEYWALVLNEREGIEHPSLATGFLEGAVEAWSAFKDEIMADGPAARLVHGPLRSRKVESDVFLDTLRCGIVLLPDNDGPRMKYAEQLAELGEHAAAERMLEQLADPSLSETVSGENAGIPQAVTVEFHRGFVASIVLPREHLRGLGKILCNHPITSVRIPEINDLILIHSNVRPEPRPTERRRKGKNGENSELPRMWAVEYRRSAMPVQVRYWSRRELMEASVGVWLDRLVPPSCPESLANAGQAAGSSR